MFYLLLGNQLLLGKADQIKRMKGSSKYNLLAKNEPRKEKEQQEWVEMQPVSSWHGKTNNNDASYMKFQEQQSEIAYNHIQNKKGNEKQTIPSTQKNKNVQSSSNMEKRMAYLQNEYQPNQSNFAPQQQNAPKVPIATQKVSNQQQYSSINPRQIQPQSYQTPPLQNPYNNYNYNPQRSQMPNNQNYPTNSRLTSTHQYQPPAQQYQSQIRQSTTNPPHMTSSTRQSTRKGIPQMTVNCDKCTFTQAVPGNTQLYICCICNQINECYPLYGVFTCGICRTNVIYPHGTSRLIKCTKCLTVNKVNPEPSKRLQEVVTLGKEVIPLQEEKAQRVEYSQERPKVKMSRHQPEEQQYNCESNINKNDMQKSITTKMKINNKPQSQPFTILPSQKTFPNQFDFFDENNMPELTQNNQLRRQLFQPSEIKQKLIDFEQFVSQKKELCQEKELLEISQRIKTTLRVEEQIKNQKQNQQRENQKQKQHQAPTLYPTIFGD